MARQCTKPKRKRDATWFRDKVLFVEAQGNGKVLNKEELEFLVDPGIVEDVLSEVPHSDNTNNDMLNQSVQDMSYFEPSHSVEHLENEIHSDSNIILYSEYLIETQNAVVHDTNSSTQQDAMILSVFEQLFQQVTNCNKVNKDNLMANESLSAELEGYKEREKEAKNIDNEIALEKKVKELDNIVHKIGQSAQTVHMLTKPQVLPMLYDGDVIAKETNVILIDDSEETLMLEEESRSKMLLKQNDPTVLEKKTNIKPVNYAVLNQLSEDFVDVPSELAKVSMVNASLKKLKLHLMLSQKVNGDLLNEITEVQTIFDQMETGVQKYSVDKRCLEIANKQALNENDRLLEQIISQDIMNIVVNSSEIMNASVNVKSMETCNKCLELEAELIKQHNMVEKDKLNATVRNIRTYNGTEFVNQTLRDYYEQVGISHETLVAQNPQQNGVVERKTPYELLHDKKPDLSYLHVFGALGYLNNDSENLGKLQAKADIGIFIGYAPKKKAYRIYNRRTRKIIETIHVDFDELTAMASEQSSLEPALHEMTPATPSSGLVPNPPPSALFVPPSRHEWDLVFQPVFVEFFSPLDSVASPVPEVPVLVVDGPAPVESTSTPSSKTVDQDAPSPRTSQTTQQSQSQEIPLCAEEDSHDLEIAHMSNDPYFGIPIPETVFEESSSSVVIHTTVHPDTPISEHTQK
ncbi:retrovirus-related pol polyprotein from transposon TNT 1-94 [Tanacetum coccineum]|uniref:Retrovirus-related pol polyprotein from transposon TNT 1-94 n=1 Tax=Tanacetum coccineum TaxID=301880 RepID=A0ABQ4WHD2_9ASTR